MWRAFLTGAVSFAGLVAFADEIPPNVKRAIEQGEIRRHERITELEGGLKLIKTRYEHLKKEFHSTDTSALTQINGRKTIQADYRNKMADEIDRLKERATLIISEIENVKAQKYYCPNMTLRTMRAGDVGILVDQSGSQQVAKITKIIDGENMIISVESQPVLMVVDTEGLKVGKKFPMTMAFEVTGTTKYKSADTTKEIFVIEQFFFPEDDPAPKQASKSDGQSVR